jgi:hypothetical protein
VVPTIYQGRHRILSGRWAVVAALALPGAAILAAAVQVVLL